MAYSDEKIQGLHQVAAAARQNGERFYVARLFESLRHPGGQGAFGGGYLDAQDCVWTAAALAAIESAGWTLVSAAPATAAGGVSYTLATFRVVDR